MQFREAIDTDAHDLLGLARAVASKGAGATLLVELPGDLAALGNDYLAQERRLDEAALELRKSWLAVAHRPADATLKSPQEGDTTRVAGGEMLRFGYERDLDVSLLEERGAAYMRPPAGWTGETVIYRSGQAALASLLQYSATTWCSRRALTVAHAGAYFETTALVAAWPQRTFRPVRPSASSADIVIAEPVWCDGRFGITTRLPRARHVVLIDTTMVGPAHDLGPLLSAGEDCSLVVAFSSGLKLDQAGLELANAGIVRILARQGSAGAGHTATRLRELRALMGGGLTVDELSALSAPWFLDRGYVDRYAAAIFANNRTLAEAIGTRSAVFGAHCHPSLALTDAVAPFCAIELRHPSPDRLRRLAEIVGRESERRGLLLTEGGSFGFRGHRFELIEPEIDAGRPFLRVALGWRGGHSCRGLVDLFAELSAHASFEAMDRAYGR